MQIKTPSSFFVLFIYGWKCMLNVNHFFLYFQHAVTSELCNIPVNLNLVECTSFCFVYLYIAICCDVDWCELRYIGWVGIALPLFGKRCFRKMLSLERVKTLLLKRSFVVKRSLRSFRSSKNSKYKCFVQ